MVSEGKEWCITCPRWKDYSYTGPSKLDIIWTFTVWIVMKYENVQYVCIYSTSLTHEHRCITHKILINTGCYMPIQGFILSWNVVFLGSFILPQNYSSEKQKSKTHHNYSRSFVFQELETRSLALQQISHQQPPTLLTYPLFKGYILRRKKTARANIPK